MSAWSTKRSHGHPCSSCGVKCYSETGMCRACTPKKTRTYGRQFPNPAAAPEDYLTECAQELLRRHQARAETLAKLGIHNITEAA